MAGCAFAGAAFAAHPLQTEDTGTQGTGLVEIEQGLSWTRTGGARAFAYQPQLSYGGSPALDLIVQPSWLSRHEGGARARGWGDTNLDAKWRFLDAAPLSVAVRAGATLAAHPRSAGLSGGRLGAHALLVASVDAAPFTLHGNLGLTRNPGEQRYTRQVSGALMWSASDRLALAVDGAAASNPDPARSAWLGTVLAGVIYTVRPGLDIDLGRQSSLRASTPTRQWLAGLTYRFAP